ncbi:MAG: DUF378 domain-containing protein [Gammaproteobacteria bacterium]
MKTFDVITFILIIIGALNWGLVGAFEFNLVASAFGPLHVGSRVTYILVGVSALYHAIAFKAIHQRWRPRPSRTL